MASIIIPLVSIRCLVYNHEPYLRQCLDGFVMQKTNFPFEAIVHDDASTDGSAAIIREYAEKYPDIIKPIYETENQYSKRDGTLTRAMDAAMHPASKYVALCEGDDYWTDPEKLQIQVDFLERHPDYSMCFHRANTVIHESGEEMHGKPGDIFRSIENRDYESTELFSVWTVPTASMVYRKECQYYPLKRRYRFLFGDIVRVLSCAEMGKVRGMDRMMSVYRVQDKGITFSPKSARVFSMGGPEHYLFVKDNFKRVNHRVMMNAISFRYWERAQCQASTLLKLKDYIYSLRYCPIHFIKRTLVRYAPPLASALKLSNNEADYQ